MFRTKILYLAILIASIVFFILYTEPLSLYLMIMILSLPIIMGVCIILAKKLIKVSIKTDSDTITKNEKINVSVNIKNKAPIPFTNCTAIIKYHNNLIDIADYISVSIPIHALSSEKISFSIVSDHCGIVNLKVVSVHVYDFLKLFSCRVKPHKTHEITVLPELYPLNSSKAYTMINSEDSDLFSKHKSGDDPSEIFVLKDYVPGDKPNRIHWNLSLKHDELIVRHYSQPISTSILLILDFCGKPDQDADVLDTAAEIAFSIAFFFSENSIPFNLVYYSCKMNKITLESISDEIDATIVIKRILAEGPLKKTYFSSSVKEVINNYSNVFYITASADNMTEIIKDSYSENFKPIFIEKENSAVNEFEQNKEVTVIPAGKTPQFISDILI